MTQSPFKAQLKGNKVKESHRSFEILRQYFATCNCCSEVLAGRGVFILESIGLDNLYMPVSVGWTGNAFERDCKFEATDAGVNYSV